MTKARKFGPVLMMLVGVALVLMVRNHVARRATVGALAVAGSMAGFSPERPKFNSLTYALNADTGHAFWLSCDQEPDAWTAEKLGESPRREVIHDLLPLATRPADYLRAPAPSFPLAPPTLEVLADETRDGLRTVRLRADSPRGAQVLEIAAEPGLVVRAARLNGVPLKQGFAVTGSVDQFGNIQPIGGVNEKIEGFFQYCEHRGLTGEQGVIIPVQNVRHLMLEAKVLEEVKAGRFSVFSVTTIDEGIELLTGVSPSTIHRKVKNRLKKWMKEGAKLKKKYKLEAEEDNNDDEE